MMHVTEETADHTATLSRKAEGKCSLKQCRLGAMQTQVQQVMPLRFFSSLATTVKEKCFDFPVSSYRNGLSCVFVLVHYFHVQFDLLV